MNLFRRLTCCLLGHRALLDDQRGQRAPAYEVRALRQDGCMKEIDDELLMLIVLVILMFIGAGLTATCACK